MTSGWIPPKVPNTCKMTLESTLLTDISTSLVYQFSKFAVFHFSRFSSIYFFSSSSCRITILQNIHKKNSNKKFVKTIRLDFKIGNYSEKSWQEVNFQKFFFFLIPLYIFICSISLGLEWILKCSTIHSNCRWANRFW